MFTKFEHRSQPLLGRRAFILRVLRHFVIATSIVGVSLSIGMLGYHFIADLAWIDALLNAAMILTGMGPVDALPNAASKIFASAYALFSGVVFLSVVAVLLAPIAHRALHTLHLDSDD